MQTPDSDEQSPSSYEVVENEEVEYVEEEVEEEVEVDDDGDELEEEGEVSDQSEDEAEAQPDTAVSLHEEIGTSLGAADAGLEAAVASPTGRRAVTSERQSTSAAPSAGDSATGALGSTEAAPEQPAEAASTAPEASSSQAEPQSAGALEFSQIDAQATMIANEVSKVCRQQRSY